MNKTKVCKKCNKKFILKNNFYYTNNTEKYPDGYLDICKDCITVGINNFDPKTYLWILQECDVPYVSSQWELLLLKGSNVNILNKKFIIGRYLTRMKLMSFRDWRWADSYLFNDLNKNFTSLFEESN